ncbi:MAG TPA: glutamate--tRNA ligase, partial [Gemmatimonadaceae bacterium]|nr:glutamate--tRNA ligase [Gemmatimonadaceae bacterium]
LHWDEGPDVGGPYAPYRQSERRALYAAAGTRLLEAGKAYPCFCGAGDPEAKSDCRCDDLAPKAAQARVQGGEAHAIRFRVPPGMVEFDDRLRGAMRIDAGTFGDFVLLRSNGLPTYNFACVVDDAAMRITHVVRGEDHLYNTARQRLLYDALAAPLPEFVHLALILDEDRGKLSKRAGRTGTYVDEYRTRGYLPEALMNFLALLGWSSAQGEELFTPAELVRQFDLDRISHSPAIFDPVKFEWMAAWHVRQRPDDELARLAAPWLRDAGLDPSPDRARAWIAGFKADLPALALLPERIQRLLGPPAPTPEAAATLASPEARRLLQVLDDKIEQAQGAATPLAGAGFKQLLQECGRELGLRGRDLFVPVRVALSGTDHGPELPLLFDALGVESVRQRLRAAIG